MASALNLAAGAAGQPRPRIVYGEVSTAQPAPASFAAPLHVVIPGWRADYFWTILNWPALHGNTLPAQGAACLLAFDDRRNLWCVSWEGAHS